MLSRFDKYDKAIERFKKVLYDTLAIYHKYESYCSSCQKNIFYNKYLSTAIDLQNKESINLITENMSNDNIKINHSNYIKHILFNLRLYTIAKMIFNVLKKR